MNEVIRIYTQMQDSHLRRAKFELQEFIEMIYDERLYKYWKPRIEYMIALIDGDIDIPDNLI
jgi:hypothetical protein